jgi:hypothetical protein
MAAKLLILLALPLSALAAGSPCAVVPASGTTAAPIDKNVVIGASVAGGAAVATGIGLLVGYEANKKKGDTKPPTPVAPVVKPPTPVAPVAPDTNARVIGDDDEAAGSASCGTLCWVGIGLLSLCVLLGLLGLLYMACSKKKTTKKKKVQGCCTRASGGTDGGCRIGSSLAAGATHGSHGNTILHCSSSDASHNIENGGGSSYHSSCRSSLRNSCSSNICHGSSNGLRNSCSSNIRHGSSNGV